MIESAGARRVVEAYFERHAVCDLEGVVALFTDDACVEDPVGQPIFERLAAVRAFYAQTHSVNGPMSIVRVGKILVGGDEAAAHVRAELHAAGSPPAMDVIYVFRLAEDGRIRRLRVWY